VEAKLSVDLGRSCSDKCTHSS